MKPEPLKVIVGANLRRWRRQNGLTQEQVAEKLSVTPRYYAGIERGERNLSLDSVETLAGALDVSLQEVFAFHR